MASEQEVDNQLEGLFVQMLSTLQLLKVDGEDIRWGDKYINSDHAVNTAIKLLCSNVENVHSCSSYNDIISLNNKNLLQTAKLRLVAKQAELYPAFRKHSIRSINYPETIVRMLGEKNDHLIYTNITTDNFDIILKKSKSWFEKLRFKTISFENDKGDLLDTISLETPDDDQLYVWKD